MDYIYICFYIGFCLRLNKMLFIAIYICLFSMVFYSYYYCKQSWNMTLVWAKNRSERENLYQVSILNDKILNFWLKSGNYKIILLFLFVYFILIKKLFFFYCIIILLSYSWGEKYITFSYKHIWYFYQGLVCLDFILFLI